MDRNDRYRNNLHFSAPRGWLNDPNGFSVYDGSYHLFYQHNPHASHWGPMHWGHAVSQDLVRWSPKPIALAPGDAFDRDGCFSGSAVEEKGRHILMYTGHTDPPAGDPSGAREVQCLAIGDGTRYRKSSANPVIGSALLPFGCSPADFRDPRLWKEGESWYCLVAARDQREGGALLLFSAPDLEHWRLVGTVASGGGSFGTMWECPDFFPLADREVLVWSPQNVARDGCRYQNIYSSVYAIGDLDRTTGGFHGSRPQELDFGPDFYAPQTLLAPDGRRILIAWMQMWERTIPTDELGHGWAGTMTIPRELEIVEGALVQQPIRELERFRTTPRTIDRSVRGALPWKEARGHYLDLDLTFTARGAGRFGVVVKEGPHQETRISYTPADGRLVLDRSHAGLPIVSTAAERPECSVSCCELRPDIDALSLRVVLDRSTCEVFADGGRRVMSATIYPDDDSDGVSLFADEGAVGVNGMVWALRPPDGDSAT